MQTMNLNGFSVEECVEKIKEELKASEAGATVISNDMPTMREVARIVGKMGFSCELWPADGMTLFVFNRINTPS